MLKELQNIINTLLTGRAEAKKDNYLDFIKLFCRLLLILLFIKAINVSLIILFQGSGFMPTAESTEGTLDKMSKWNGFLLAALVAPVIEELTFRLGLRFSRWNFIIMGTGFTYLIAIVIIGLPLKLSVVTALAFLAISYVVLTQEIILKSETAWKDHDRIIFYFLLTCFVAFHLSNYNMSIRSIPSILLLMIPHAIGGTIFSYARLRSGILLAIALHIFNNAIFLLPELVLK